MASLPPGELFDDHSIGGYVEFRVDLEVVAKTEVLTPVGNRTVVVQVVAGHLSELPRLFTCKKPPKSILFFSMTGKLT